MARKATDSNADVIDEVIEDEELEELTNEADLNDTDEEVEEDEDTESIVRPKDLAEELDIDPKTLRGFLRREFPRPSSEKNTSWVLTEEHIAAAREEFADDEDDDEDEVDEDTETDDTDEVEDDTTDES